MGTTPQPRAEGPSEAGGVLSADTPCRKCGYNLRGLDALGRCPECGTPIGLSLHGPLLRYADPRWVESLARGVTLILWGLLIMIVGSTVGGALAGVIGATGMLYLRGLLWLGAVLGLWGTWLLTVPDPSGLGENEYGRIRRLTRLAAAVGVLSTAIGFISEALPFRPLALAIGITAEIGSLVGWGGEFFKFWFMEKLAVRIPAEDLARRARFLRWSLVSTGMLLVIFGLVVTVGVLATGPAGGPGGAQAAAAPTGGAGGVVNVGGFAVQAQTGRGSLLVTFLTAASCFVVLLMLVTFMLTFVAAHMQWRLRNALRRQARVARQTWAAAFEQAAGPPPPTTGH